MAMEADCRTTKGKNCVVALRKTAGASRRVLRGVKRGSGPYVVVKEPHSGTVYQQRQYIGSGLGSSLTYTEATNTKRVVRFDETDHISDM